MKPQYFFRFWQGLLGFFGRIIHRIRVIGAENVPTEGPLIVASNHVHAIDPMIHAYCIRRDMWTMAKKELFDNPVIGAALRSVGAFPVARGHGDRAAVAHALEILDKGGMLMVFPEGTRSKTGELGVFKTGAAMFAIQSGAPVVPAVIVAPRGMRWFSPVTVVYGEPLYLNDCAQPPATSAEIRRCTNIIRDAVAELLSGEYPR